MGVVCVGGVRGFCFWRRVQQLPKDTNYSIYRIIMTTSHVLGSRVLVLAEGGVFWVGRASHSRRARAFFGGRARAYLTLK